MSIKTFVGHPITTEFGDYIFAYVPNMYDPQNPFKIEFRFWQIDLVWDDERQSWIYPDLSPYKDIDFFLPRFEAIINVDTRGRPVLVDIIVTSLLEIEPYITKELPLDDNNIDETDSSDNNEEKEGDDGCECSNYELGKKAKKRLRSYYS